MSAFLLSLFIVFIAEMGDKTQLVALCFATKYNAKVVLAGVFAATLAVHVVSVLIGGAIGGIISAEWISLASGLAFVGFGFWTLRGDSLEDDSCDVNKGRTPFWAVAITFFLAELGDKTMISTVTLATQHTKDLIPVWLGSTLGMVLSDGLAIVVGNVLGSKLPERAVKIGAAVIFFGFGAFSIYSIFSKMPAAILAAIPVVIVIMAYFFLRQPKTQIYASPTQEKVASSKK